MRPSRIRPACRGLQNRLTVPTVPLVYVHLKLVASVSRRRVRVRAPVTLPNSPTYKTAQVRYPDQRPYVDSWVAFAVVRIHDGVGGPAWVGHKGWIDSAKPRGQHQHRFAVADHKSFDRGLFFDSADTATVKFADPPPARVEEPEVVVTVPTLMGVRVIAVVAFLVYRKSLIMSKPMRRQGT